MQQVAGEGRGEARREADEAARKACDQVVSLNQEVVSLQEELLCARDEVLPTFLETDLKFDSSSCLDWVPRG